MIEVGNRMLSGGFINGIIKDELVRISEIGDTYYKFEGYGDKKFPKKYFVPFEPLCGHCDEKITTDHVIVKCPDGWMKHYHTECMETIAKDYRMEKK